ncbi:MAG: glycosyltransferase [Vicinamibacterales bacterium]
MSGALNVLMVTGYTPFAPVSGGRTRTLGVMESLRGRVRFTLACLARPEEQVEDMDRLRATCDVVLVPRPPSPTLRAAAGMLVRSPRPFTEQVYRSPALGRRLGTLLATQTFDLVHVESFYLLQNLPRPCPVPVLLVDSAIEYVAWGRHAAHGLPAWQRPGFALEALKTRIAEPRAWRAADAVGVVSEVDRALVARLAPEVPVCLTPNGVDVHRFSPPLVPRAPAVAVFIGDYKYFPNVDAAVRLVRHIAPAVRAAHPDFTVRLIGKDPPEAVRALAGPGIVVTGAVPDVVPHLREASVFVCPVRSGSGTRTKLLEAMAAGCPVVTTAVGAEGLDLVPGVDALFGDTDPDLARAVRELLASPTRAHALATGARATAVGRFSWQVSADCHEAVYRRVAALRRRPASSAAPSAASIAGHSPSQS